MAVIAIVNRKGGSGKSTLATHVATWLAQQGLAVALGDLDRQQSSQTWLRRRQQQGATPPARLSGWNVDPRSVVRPPAGSTHLVLDTPGGLRGFDLARVVMYADAILMPVCNSAFDRESAADCVAELRTLPRVAGGRCRLAAVGMRLDARTKAEAVLRDWAAQLALPFVGVLRDTQGYVRCIDEGLTMFDLPPARAGQDLAQWQPILDWLRPVVRPADAAADSAHRREPTEPAAAAPRLPRPARTVEASGARTLPAAATATPMATAIAEPPRAPPASARPAAQSPTRPAASRSTRFGRLLDALAIPRFLQRDP